MYGWEALDRAVLKPAGAVTSAFLAAGLQDFREAAAYIERMPYGRNLSPADPLAVLEEGRGTCSTKHALLRRLAIEQHLEIALVLGIYQMNQRNTPGVGTILAKYRLDSLPEAHCYLRTGDKKIDVTGLVPDSPAGRIPGFLYEEDIAPDQIGAYKAGLHRRFLKQWMEGTATGNEYTLTELWRIREDCIRALERRGRQKELFRRERC